MPNVKFLVPLTLSRGGTGILLVQGIFQPSLPKQEASCLEDAQHLLTETLGCSIIIAPKVVDTWHHTPTQPITTDPVFEGFIRQRRPEEDCRFVAAREAITLASKRETELLAEWFRRMNRQ